MSEIRFDGRVAIVTGAGGGLGRSHALMLASRGARVVVNDLGGAVDGSGSGSAVADAVVEEIRSAGGEGAASYDSVSDPEGAAGIVKTATDAFGKLDIVINNAGILRDVSFKKMSQADWDAVLAVHLTGTMNVTKAAWGALRDNGFGRIVNTTSAAGLYGNFGQANYSAAKMGIVGFTKTIGQEGAKYDVKANVIAPVAKSRMTESILPPELLNKLAPELVSPLVGYLCSDGLAETGQVYAVGGGYVSRVQVVEGTGVHLEGELTPDVVAEHWARINDMDGARAFANAMEAAQQALGKG